MSSLLTQPYFALFLLIALGIIVGHINIRGISLDSAAVLFVALIFGHFGVVIPDEFQKIGLVLFIFTIGMQSGPGFFEAFKRQGRQLIVTSVLLILSASLITIGLALVFHIDFGLAVGLLTGALTSTPGLAAAIEGSQSPLASIGYGIAYPFGVIGVILFVRFLPKLFKVDLEQSRMDYQAAEEADYPELQAQNFIVENQNITGKSLRELKVTQMTDATVSRVMHDDVAFSPTPETVLEPGDLIRAVGTDEALDRIKLLVGKNTDQEIPLAHDYDFQWILVTNKNVVNKSLGQLNLLERYNATVTRIRRSGVEITPQPHRKIRFGDRLMVISAKGDMSRVSSYLGNEDKRLSETDFLPIALGVVLGVLLGKVRIPLFGGMSFSLGMTGGILAVALIMSRIGKTGPVIWTMSGSANSLLRQLGLLFFLAAVGSSAGSHLVSTFTEYGPKLFLIGGVITLIPMIVGTLVAMLVYRMNFITMLGVLTGSMTSTPGLAAVDSMTESNAPQVGYATVYPIALVGIIIAAKIIGKF